MIITDPMIGRGVYSTFSKFSFMTPSMPSGRERLMSMTPVAILRPLGPYHLCETVVMALAINGKELDKKSIPNVYLPAKVHHIPRVPTKRARVTARFTPMISIT